MTGVGEELVELSTAFVESADAHDGIGRGDDAYGNGRGRHQSECYGCVVGVGIATNLFKDIESVALRNIF